MRKSILAILVCMALILCAIPALAEGCAIAQISDGTTLDFDGDGAQETLTFTFEAPNEYDEINGFTLTVGDQTVAVDDATVLAGKVYAVSMVRGIYCEPGLCWGTLFMVPEFGMSDDPYSYCYLYTDGKLTDVGGICSLPDGMVLGADGCISCQIRANHLGTWSRYSVFELANGISFGADDSYQEHYHLCEVRQDLYAMGMIVDLKKDLALKDTRYDAEASREIKAGQKVILAATDDVRWVYVTTMDDTVGGWVDFICEDYPDMINVNGTYTDIDEVFDNIIYAD